MSFSVPVDTYSTGAVRESGKSERYDLIPPEPIRLLAVLYGVGAKKYEERNWEKGLPYSNMYNSLMRHLDSWQKREEIDPDTGSLHLVSALWNIVGLIEFTQTHPEMDDRAPKKKEQPVSIECPCQ